MKKIPPLLQAKTTMRMTPRKPVEMTKTPKTQQKPVVQLRARRAPKAKLCLRRTTWARLKSPIEEI